MYEGRLLEADKALANQRNLNEHLQKELAKLGKSPQLRVVSKDYVEVMNESEPSARTNSVQDEGTSHSTFHNQIDPRTQRTDEERYSDVFFEDEAEGSEDSYAQVHIKTVPDQTEGESGEETPEDSDSNSSKQEGSSSGSHEEMEEIEDSHGSGSVDDSFSEGSRD